MADSVSSSGPAVSAAPSYDPYADDVGQVSRADAPNSSQAPPRATSSQAEPAPSSSTAVSKLVSSVPPPPSALPAAAPPPASTANNNAQRTRELNSVGPYAGAGYAATGDSVYAGAALVKGRDPGSGAEVEVLSASAQFGAQTELQVGLQRVAGTSGPVSGSVEAFTLRAQFGTRNDDGSEGLNIGATATAIGFEGTLGGASSLTYGVSAGAGAAASVGVRDVDRDGKAELCVRASLLAATVGICLENPL